MIVFLTLVGRSNRQYPHAYREQPQILFPVNYLLAKDQVASRFIDLTNVNASPSFCFRCESVPDTQHIILYYFPTFMDVSFTST